MTTGPSRCIYALRPADRPGCQLTATVTYGGIALCSACDAQRSTLGKGQAGRPPPATRPPPPARPASHPPAPAPSGGPPLSPAGAPQPTPPGKGRAAPPLPATEPDP